jgi:DNA-binding NarL/FixJ family response regulator
VEDEERLQRSIGQILERAGYIVLPASHGDGALRILEEHQGRIDLVLTDVGLPHMRGPELVGAPQESTRQYGSALHVRVRRGRPSARRSISTVRPIHTKTIPERHSSSKTRGKFSPTILTEKFVPYDRL